jgi:hypothetical protein
MALDSVLLVEADTLYIGYPFGLAVDPFDGSFYVSDSFSRRVYRFRRDGTLAGTYGRPGRGPGEFTSHAQVAVVDDSTVATPGMNPPALYLFDRQDGRLRSTSPLPPVLLGTGQLVVRGGDLLMAARPLDGATSLLVWDLVSGSSRLLGQIPPEYERSRQGAGYFATTRGGGAVAAGNDVVLRGWFGLDRLDVFGWDGALVARVGLPAVRRRGVPAGGPEILDRGRAGPLGSYVEEQEFHSWLSQMARVPGGDYVVTHHDLHTAQDHGASRRTVFSADLYLSVLSADLRTACLDGPVPVAGQLQPREAVAGDTLFVLDRRVRPAGAIESWIVLYGIDTAGCDWLETDYEPLG